jgi:hypothetical protein
MDVEHTESQQATKSTGNGLSCIKDGKAASKFSSSIKGGLVVYDLQKLNQHLVMTEHLRADREASTY